MKRKNILFIALLIFINPFIYSQNKVSANFGYGIYLNNSENSTNLLGDNNFRSYLFYGISYKRETVLGLNLMFEYSYHQITKNDVLVFVLQSDFGDSISFGTDVTLISHNSEIEMFIGFGPVIKYYLFNNYISPFIKAGYFHNIYNITDHYSHNRKSFPGFSAEIGIGLNYFVTNSFAVESSLDYVFSQKQIEIYAENSSTLIDSNKKTIQLIIGLLYFL